LQSSLLDPDTLPADWRDRAQPWRIFCDADQCGDLVLTTFRAGMTIAPLGMGGYQRNVGDIFTDNRIPPYLRPGWPVVVREDGMVVWLCGLALSESVRIQPTTRHVRHLRWQLEMPTKL
jgi:tRNA(Ile)-lysidine synthase